MTLARFSRPARVPNHPPPLDRAAQAIGGKTVDFQFTGTREEAQAILDEIDRQVAEAATKAAERPRGGNDV